MSENKFITSSGIEIKEVYATCKPMQELPAEFPFTRGIQKDMYRGRLWTMRQYAGFSTAEESNKRYHYLLQNGTMGYQWLSICLRKSDMIAHMKCRKGKLEKLV